MSIKTIRSGLKWSSSLNLISLAVEELDVRSSCREEGITFRIRITFMLGSRFKDEMLSYWLGFY